eukprot:snap_masked-scaffold_62-processed-gene-0.20-mRNA-1 protein AED:1.00 eAED:1.00 QI:0/0/0/0/1/1/4/0/734
MLISQLVVFCMLRKTMGQIYTEETFNVLLPTEKINLHRNIAAQLSTTLPSDLPDEQFYEEYMTRQSLIKNQVVNFDLPNVSNAFLLKEMNVSFDFQKAFGWYKEDILKLENPDFHLVSLVRYIFMTDDENEKKFLFNIVNKIPLWFTKGEHLRVYWSENHIIMYSSSAFLLRQEFGENATKPEDPYLRERIIFYLESKIANGYFEYFSHTYFQYTLMGLLNLFDLSKDTQIRNLAENALDRLISDWMVGTTRNGLSFSVSGRSSFDYYLLSHGAYFSKSQQIIALLTGLGPLIENKTNSILKTENKTHYLKAGVCMLAVSKYNPTNAVKTFRSSGYWSLSLGLSNIRNSDFKVDYPDGDTKSVTHMSSGGYAHPKYIIDTFSLVAKYNMWNHKFFSSYNYVKYLSSNLLQSAAEMVTSVSAGGLVNIESLKIWKNNNIMLSTVENYYGGFRGYQQLVFVASVDDVAVFTSSLSITGYESVGDIGKVHMNFHLPRNKQDENIGLSVYNPNADLDILKFETKNVMIYFPDGYFDESARIKIDENKKIFLGRRNESYVALFMFCKDYVEHQREKEIFKLCRERKNAFGVILGNDELHQNFTQFKDKMINSVQFSAKSRLNCISASIEFEGKILKEDFCRNLGGFYVSMITVFSILFTVFLILFMCLRKKRRLWKKTYNYFCAKFLFFGTEVKKKGRIFAASISEVSFELKKYKNVIKQNENPHEKKEEHQDEYIREN